MIAKAKAAELNGARCGEERKKREREETKKSAFIRTKARDGL